MNLKLPILATWMALFAFIVMTDFEGWPNWARLALFVAFATGTVGVVAMAHRGVFDRRK